MRTNQLWSHEYARKLIVFIEPERARCDIELRVMGVSAEILLEPQHLFQKLNLRPAYGRVQMRGRWRI